MDQMNNPFDGFRPNEMPADYEARQNAYAEACSQLMKAREKILVERLIFPASAELRKAIEDYRFANRIPSQSEAIRRLIESGLRAQALADDVAGQIIETAETAT